MEALNLFENNYAFARKSSFSNLGEDVIGSARHKRNESLNLEEAEKEGTAEEVVKRDALLKSDSVELPEITKKNYLVVLTSYLCIKGLPSKPQYKRGSTDEQKKRDRKNYVKTYFRMKRMCELNAISKNESELIISNSRNEVKTLIREFRAENYYCKTANLLCTYHNNVLANSERNNNSVMKKVNQFIKCGEALEAQELVEKVRLVVIKNKGIAAAFGIKKFNKSSCFKRSSIYLGEIKREGPRVELEGQGEKEKFLLEKLSLRGLQWGNYVTDSERKNFLTLLCEAFHDLKDTLGLSNEILCGNGQLALAIGARGSGSALAHFEPSLNVINLTKNKGFGSLAHEWAHFIDRIIYKMVLKKSGSYFSEYSLHPRFFPVENEEALQLLIEFNEFFQVFKRRLARDEQLQKESRKKQEYWKSRCEMFARAFESYLFKKLGDEGRKSYFLVGLNSHTFWPNDEELKQVTPLFDRLFSWLSSNS